MTSEEIIVSIFGKSVRDLRVSMINVNSLPSEGTEDASMPNTQKFLEQCSKFYPTLLKNYRDDIAANGATAGLADKIFMPLWFSPSSSTKKSHPKDFEGDHRSDKLCKEMGLFATHQVFALFDNPTFCAALGSKRKFDSLGVKSPELMVPEAGFTGKEAAYAVERGACNTVGIKTTDHIRYVAVYKCEGGKSGISLICGSHNFLSGSLDIFKDLGVHVDIMMIQQKNTKRRGIDILDVPLGFVSKDKKDQLKASSVAISRLIGGAIYTHDHLCILRDIYGVRNLISFDRSAKSEMTKVDIEKVIAEYAHVKKYYFVAKALNSIKIK